MTFFNQGAEIFVPDAGESQEALKRTTDLCIVAHQDDIEIMAYGPIAICFGKADRHFTGVVVTDGSGSPRSGVYADYTDEDMKAVRATEQKNAALIGRYSAQILLCHSSGNVKKPGNRALIDELKQIISTCAPEALYTHNLADKHDTHVSVVLRVIEALREIPPDKRPKKVISMEGWRGLDWLCDEDKSVHDTGAYPNLSSALLGVYDSQISGGKRYDLASLGRRQANATFLASHAVDELESATYGLDITELVNSDISEADFIGACIDRFRKDVTERIIKFSKSR